jgi:precorrin-6B methylase 2
VHPVSQGLTVHAAGFGRRFAVHAIEHQRKRLIPTARNCDSLGIPKSVKL